jgi:HEAT repeat protein
MNGQAQLMTLQLNAVGLLDLTPDERYEAVSELIRANPTQMRQIGASLLHAPAARLRAWGADILGQVATVSERPARPIATLLLAALETEKAVTVIASIVTGLRHAEDRRGQRVSLSLVDHQSSTVREAVAFTLSAFSDLASSQQALIRLSADSNTEVRNWATFGLATSNSRRVELLDALAARLDDEDFRTSVEALIGILERCDRDAIDALTAHLRRPSIRKWAAGVAHELGAQRKARPSAAATSAATR